MIELKREIASKMVGCRYHFKCDCLTPLDFVGVIRDFTIQGNEIVFSIDSNGRIVKIGENHPNMMIERV